MSTNVRMGKKWDVRMSEYCLSVTLYKSAEQKSISAHLWACPAQVEAELWCTGSPELNKAAWSDEAARLLLTAQDLLSVAWISGPTCLVRTVRTSSGVMLGVFSCCTVGLLIRISHIFLATHWPQYFSCRHSLITVDTTLSQMHKVKAVSSCFGGLQWQASRRLRGDHRWHKPSVKNCSSSNVRLNLASNMRLTC